MGQARRIAIVGAGLGGLAAAITLRLQGFGVRVYEQAPKLAEFGAGINISPNSVKFFQATGLADKLAPFFAQRAAKKQAAQTSKRTVSDPRRSRRRLLQQNRHEAADPACPLHVRSWR